MQCPVCRQPMIIVEYQNIELDACPECEGVWFDAQELGQMFELAGALERYAELESQLDRLPHTNPRRTCPRCREKIVPVRAPSSERELILDECPRGDGIWFDQGELDALLRCVLDPGAQSLADIRSYLGAFAAPSQMPGGDSP